MLLALAYVFCNHILLMNVMLMFETLRVCTCF